MTIWIIEPESTSTVAPELNQFIPIKRFQFPVWNLYGFYEMKDDEYHDSSLEYEYES